MTSFAVAPPALGASMRLCSLPQRLPVPAKAPSYPATAASRAVISSAAAGANAIRSRSGLRPGQRVQTRCSNAGGPGELYKRADGEALDRYTAGGKAGFSESFYDVKDVSSFLSDLTKDLANEFAVIVENVSELNESAAVVTWHLDLNGKSVPFTRGRTLYEYSRGPKRDQLEFKNVHVTIEPPVNQLGPHLVRPEIVSWAPRILLYRNFLTSEECAYLIELASPKLDSSLVASKDKPQAYQSHERTSSGMFLSHQEEANPTVQAIDKRIAICTHIPKENGERIQVLRYQKGQYFTEHHDYFSDGSGNDRVATMFMYLSDDFEGGETYFPKVGDGQCFCGGLTKTGWSIKPTKGDAIFFWNLGLEGKMEPNTLHEGCNVLSGEKWVAVKWLREKNFSE